MHKYMSNVTKWWY